MNRAITHPALPAGVTLRAAAAADIPAMISLVNVAFEQEAFFVNRPRTHQHQLEEHFRLGYFLLAHRGPRLVASVYYELRGQRGYIGMLAVCPDDQRQGLGRAMMQAAEQALGEAGCKIAELSVVDVRTLPRAIYGKFGYREAGVAKVPEELRQKLTMPIQLIKMEKPL